MTRETAAVFSREVPSGLLLPATVLPALVCSAKRYFGVLAENRFLDSVGDRVHDLFKDFSVGGHEEHGPTAGRTDPSLLRGPVNRAAPGTFTRYFWMYSWIEASLSYRLTPKTCRPRAE